jgi:hypothetical protein
MKWRIGEVSDPSAPNYDPLHAPPYEIQTLWESESATFAAEVTVPPANLRAGSTYRVRVKHMDDTGRWSHWSAPVEFTTAAPDISAYRRCLVVSEIMYHPPPATPGEFAAGYETEDFEFVELLNTGDISLDLGPVNFTDGIAAALSGILGPGERILLVRNRAAFEARYGTGLPVAGEYSGKLSNSGETITLSFGLDQVIRTFTYSDGPPWPAAADGDGPSLVLVAPDTNPDHDLAANWRASTEAGGNPGTTDAVEFTGDPEADEDHDGLAALAEHAFGSSDHSPGPSPVSTQCL